MLTDGRRLDQIKSNLLESPLKDWIVQALWCLSAIFLATLGDGDVSRRKLYIEYDTRNVPKVAHSVFL